VDAILQVRMSSSRLPGKALLPVLGRPLLWYNIERIRLSRMIDRVVVATSTDPADDVITAACEGWGTPVFRGSLNDVLDRIYGCARHFEMDVFAKFTADNPLIDPCVIDAVIAGFRSNPAPLDYYSNNHPPTWPDGQEIEVIRTAALESAWRESQEAFQREHVTVWLWDQPQRFRVGNLARSNNAWYQRYRWTLDFPEDYVLIRRIFEELYPAQPAFGTTQIMALIDRKPELAELNRRHKGDVWYRHHRDSLQTVAKEMTLESSRP